MKWARVRKRNPLNSIGATLVDGRELAVRSLLFQASVQKRRSILFSNCAVIASAPFGVGRCCSAVLRQSWLEFGTGHSAVQLWQPPSCHGDFGRVRELPEVVSSGALSFKCWEIYKIPEKRQQLKRKKFRLASYTRQRQQRFPGCFSSRSRCWNSFISGSVAVVWYRLDPLFRLFVCGPLVRALEPGVYN